MIVDSSAIVAIAFNEPGAEKLVPYLVGDHVGVATPTWLETSIVLAAGGFPDPHGFLAEFDQEFRIGAVAFTAEHGRAARDAWERFGKGNHPARLNYGDCIAYATAKVAGEPLLFVGDDFALTDIEPAVR